ncbi:hypothetical protein [Paenibacillus apiarius]|uniref:hypothetical protein n=1 Tax=Paenibacillus apiarius TaxID=46240 RepID=UPI003B3A1384
MMEKITRRDQVLKKPGTAILALLCAGSLLWGHSVNAEAAPPVQLEKTYDMYVHETKTFQDAQDGGIIFTKRSAGTSQTELVHLDESGELSTRISLPENRYIEGLKQTQDGGYLISSISGTDKNIKVSKLDETGEIIWEQSLNHTTKYTPAYFAETSTDGYILGATITVPDGKEDLYVAKLDRDGGLQWEKTIAGPNRNIVANLIGTADGGVVLLGLWTSVSDILDNYDLYASKIDAEGNAVWEVKHETGNNTYATDAVETPDGGVIITGSDATIDYASRSTGYLLKLDGDGSVEWEQTLPSEWSQSGLKSIRATDDGNYMVSGYANYKRINGGFSSADEYVAKINGSGQTIWHQLLAGDKDGVQVSRSGIVAKQTSDNGYAALGVDRNSNKLFFTKLHQP